MQFFIATAVALAALTSAAPAPSSHVLHEKRYATSQQWQKRSRVPADAILPMKLALTQQGMDTAADWLHDV